MSISVPRKPAEPSAPKGGRSWQTKLGEGIAGPYRSLPVILALAILWIVFNSANSAARAVA